MKCIFIYNPKSGRGKIVKKLDYIKKRLLKKYETVDVYATKAAGDLTLKVREVADNYDCIVFSGGDGTFNEVLRGIGDREELPLLGYIPGGTANDVAHSLKIPRKSVRGALNVILDGRRELLDCMLINGEDYAIYSVSAGAFTSATYDTPQKTKRAFGIVGYALYGIRKNFPFKIFPVKISDGVKEIETESIFTLAMNGKCVAGMKMNPKGSMTDGFIEGAVIKQVEKPSFLRRIGAFFRLIGLFLFGYRFKPEKITHFKSESIKFEVSEDVVWNYDGERGRSGSIEIKSIPKKVPLLVPKNNKNI